MNAPSGEAALLIAEDDDEDFLLTQKAFERAGLKIPLHRVQDGEELLEFLLRGAPPPSRAVDGRAPGTAVPLPPQGAGSGILLILLDLNMPRKNGREALREIKSHPELKRLPVVVLTTSRLPEDVALSYDLGVNSFIRKPFSFPELVETIATLKKYWLDVVALPPPTPIGGNP